MDRVDGTNSAYINIQVKAKRLTQAASHPTPARRKVAHEEAYAA